MMMVMMMMICSDDDDDCDDNDHDDDNGNDLYYDYNNVCDAVDTTEPDSEAATDSCF